MDRFTGLGEYIQTKEFKERLDIPYSEKIECRLLAQGEYNVNYLFGIGRGYASFYGDEC